MKQTICLSMICKNEAHVIQRALDSAAPYVDRYCIVDTGSTDGTQNTIKKHEALHLYERPWVNFEHNRNEALELARPLADYILFLDADDMLQFPENFEWPKLVNAGYNLPVHYNELIYGRCALIKSDAPWKWCGVLHEYLTSDVPLQQGFLDWPRIKIIGGGARSQDSEKYKKDAEVLEKALKDEPNNARYCFYLAQSYRDAGEKNKAICFYKHRITMQGFVEENWYSKYQIAILKEQTQYEPTLDYLEAYQIRPTRAEPLYQLARYHRCKGNYDLAYMFAARGCAIPQPPDILFLDTTIYQWRLKEEKALASWYIGKKDEGKVILEMLIYEGKGEIEHYKKTLEFYR